jgi:hypothetical protein
MNRLMEWASVPQLKRLVAVVLAGLLLVLNVACTAPDAPMASGPGSYNEKRGANTNLYEPTQPKRDGMNSYDDDVRDVSPGVKAKAQALVDNAKRNIGQTEDRKEIPSKVLKSAENKKDEISKEAKERKEGFVEGTKEGMQNLKGNLNRASREIPEVVKEGTENAKTGIKRSGDSVKQTVDTLKHNIDETM